MSALELGRLFSLMEGVDPEGLFSAALRMTGGSAAELGAAGLAGALPPAVQGLEGLAASHMEDGVKSGTADGSGGTSDEEGSRGSAPNAGGVGGSMVPPRTGSINDRKCTKVLPASSSAPKYKFVVPNEYVYKFMQHLVERPFHMRDPSGKLWDCVLIQRKNKEKYEYMIQGWRRFGETTGVQEGDTVTIEMVEDSVMQLTIERTGPGSANAAAAGANNASAKKRPRQSSAGPAVMGGHASHAMGGGPPQFADRQLLAAAQLQQQHQLAQHEQEAEAASRELLQAQGLLPATLQQQQQAAAQAQAGLPPQQHAAQQQQAQPTQPHGLAALLAGGGQQAAAAAAAAGGNPGRPGSQPATVTPRSLTQSLANGLVGPLVQLAAGGNFNEAQLADLTDMISRLEKRQRLAGDGAAAGGGAAAAAGGGPAAPGQAGAIRLLSDAADVEGLVQENMGLREELRMLQAKIATLETGVLNIKSVLTRNTDPGLIAMTGVINLLNQMESPDFLPELGTIGRMTLTGLCSEVRRHLNGVLRMVWILRSLPDDVQQHNMGSAPGNSAD
ncbi:hypothetical protein C2E21_4115 [Chlorella sorokiniana]|uniref:TF-B3 domain-containing protein n=1 Tax=Chlorella sorokiniana TaxID=3076 RepID=A0A2P6TTY7_CHLSO|nr:hypothetical protein C2E21_4115 [Chlorella sorokiniana]|eukprot:PRW57535.1 hypothetical protein C2E21_4115 [Chlorella sorokiniana]